jgi:HD superfamily phosphodiesterase
MNRIDRLAQAMMEFFRGDAEQIQHFVKVYTYAGWIAKWEGLDGETCERIAAAALTHDIGIKPAREKYGSSAGALQEQEGPAVAEPMLKEIGFEPEVIERVCYLIGHHHTYTSIDQSDYQILIEADYLVNAEENHDSPEDIQTAFRNIFRTKSGRHLLEEIYLL